MIKMKTKGMVCIDLPKDKETQSSYEVGCYGLKRPNSIANLSLPNERSPWVMGQIIMFLW